MFEVAVALAPRAWFVGRASMRAATMEGVSMLGFIYSIVSYAAFLAVYTYFAWFSDGLGVAKNVDSGVASSVATAVITDAALVLVFGLQHSIMARAGWKRMLTRFIPPALERSTYVAASSLALALLMWQWSPIPTVIWRVESPTLVAALWIANALGWVGVPVSSLLIDHFDLFGLKPALAAFRRVTFERKGFVTPLFYRYVRHPMMTSLLVAFWATPTMTAGHLLLSLGMTVYILVGVHFEERALARELGAPYARYRARTPRFFPMPMKKEDGVAGASSSPA